MKVIRIVGLIVIALMLLTTTIAGMRDAVENLDFADSILRKIAIAGQFLYAVSGLLALFAVITKKNWSLWALATWAFAVTATAALAPVAWGDAGWAAALGAGSVTLIATGLIVWGGHRIVLAGRQEQA
jgi:hypothetical protein